MRYLIALLEGFTTLAVEIVAIRLATPIVGSSIVLTSVFLGIILLALSAGYRMGGRLASKHPPEKLKRLLLWYLISSGLFYGFITFTLEQKLLETLLTQTNNYILTLFLVALVLFFLPVFIASQTIPLLTELIPEKSKGKAAGSMLFASTIGSFLGSVGTSIVLFDWLGVMKTSVVVSCILLLCAIILARSIKRSRGIVLFIGSILVGSWLWRRATLSIQNINGLVYHHDSAYQEIIIRNHLWKDNRMTRIFHTNRAFASGIYKDTKESPFEYVKEMMQLVEAKKPRRILVIGTAGFTFPHQLSKLDYVEQIDAIDIDPRILDIATTYFLEEPLSPKITFYPQSARYFVNQAQANKKTYDLILLDAYNGKTLPDELATEEFFSSLEALAPAEGITANFIFDTTMQSDLARNVLTTRRTVFGDVWTKNVSNNPQHTFDNFIVTMHAVDPLYKQFTSLGHLYTDDKRSTETDLVAMRWGSLLSN